MLWGRSYFAVQALAGASWWIAVFTLPVVREATLGALDPVIVASVDVPLFVVGSALAAAGIRVAAFVSTGWTALVAIALAGYATVTTEAGVGVLLMIAAAGASLLALALVVHGRIPTEWIIAGPFGFRPARPGSRHVLATFVQLVVFWGVFLVVLPVIINALEKRWGLAVAFPAFVVPVAIVILLLASALGISSAIAMSTRGEGTPLPSAMAAKLVISGPYRFVRNPMALAGIVQGAAVGILLSSWLVVVYAIAGSLLWNYAVRPHEEADLAARFGEEFREYCAEVRCWIPRLHSGTSHRGALL